MPYIKQENRDKLDECIMNMVHILQGPGMNEGDMNYVITRILAASYDMQNEPRYSKINTIMGILECVKQEFYTRMAVGYEHKKRIENGDVEEYS